jgi:hypothetical protein
MILIMWLNAFVYYLKVELFKIAAYNKYLTRSKTDKIFV